MPAPPTRRAATASVSRHALFGWAAPPAATPSLPWHPRRHAAVRASWADDGGASRGHAHALARPTVHIGQHPCPSRPNLLAVSLSSAGVRAAAVTKAPACGRHRGSPSPVRSRPPAPPAPLRSSPPGRSPRWLPADALATVVAVVTVDAQSVADRLAFAVAFAVVAARAAAAVAPDTAVVADGQAFISVGCRGRCDSGGRRGRSGRRRGRGRSSVCRHVLGRCHCIGRSPRSPQTSPRSLTYGL